jgi:hypothetical protein
MVPAQLTPSLSYRRLRHVITPYDEVRHSDEREPDSGFARREFRVEAFLDVTYRLEIDLRQFSSKSRGDWAGVRLDREISVAAHDPQLPRKSRCTKRRVPTERRNGAIAVEVS